MYNDIDLDNVGNQEGRQMVRNAQSQTKRCGGTMWLICRGLILERAEIFHVEEQVRCSEELPEAKELEEHRYTTMWIQRQHSCSFVLLFPSISTASRSQVGVKNSPSRFRIILHLTQGILWPRWTMNQNLKSHPLLCQFWLGHLWSMFQPEETRCSNTEKTRVQRGFSRGGHQRRSRRVNVSSFGHGGFHKHEACWVWGVGTAAGWCGVARVHSSHLQRNRRGGLGSSVLLSLQRIEPGGNG